MTPLKEFNICIIKPANYEYSEIFMDQANYYKYQFAKFGYSTTIGFNNLRSDVTNFVFGACLGFDPNLRNSYPCIFVNLEQLGPNGAKNYSNHYLELLHSSPVIDYDPENVQFYAQPNTIPIAPILYAPYLTEFNPIPLNDRKIDILFFGSMTPRRINIIQKIVESGIKIEYIKKPTFADELYDLIRNSKCVLNIHAYESSLFEQARASICLSLGTPVVSERTAYTNPHPDYEDSIFWINDNNYSDFFLNKINSNDFYKSSLNKINNFKLSNDTNEYYKIISLGKEFLEIHKTIHPSVESKDENCSVNGDVLIDPIISICIPTYNRSEMLEKTLQSITTQDVFKDTNKIEIIISDNNSSDDTSAVAFEFTKLFPHKITYHKNSKNLSASENFGISLSLGSGKLLKLHNDSFTFIDGTLAIVLNIIENKINEKSILFFTNNQVPHNESITITNTLDQFLAHVSIQSTWIGGFCIWRSDFTSASDFSANGHLELPQTEKLLKMVEEKESAFIINEQVFEALNIKKSVPYDVSEVFGINYINLLNSYVEKGALKASRLITEKKNVLEKIILPFLFKSINDFNNTNLLSKIKNFTLDPYYGTIIENHKNSLHNKILSEADFLKAWKNNNRHNEIEPKTIFPLSRVKVGNMSYGPIIVRWWGASNEYLSIGHFCSISSDVEFLLGGNHQHDLISTFPFKVKFFGQNIEAQSKGAIIIKDDVWIGHRSLILSGVTIGQGAVIAAGSIVTKDVPPYSIIAGNPGRVVRFRFSKLIIENLLKLDFGGMTRSHIFKLENLLNTAINPNNQAAIIDELKSLINTESTGAINNFQRS